jgi:hypothetical protein
MPAGSLVLIRKGIMAEQTVEELKAEIERLKTQQTKRDVTFKVSDKGAVSVYGMGRFPVTLYQEQWLKLLDKAEEIRQFIADNKSKLKVKE